MLLYYLTHIMATKRRKQPVRKPEHPRSFFDDLSPHTKQAIGAVFFVVLATFFVFSSFGVAGVAGEYTHRGLSYLFGFGFFFAPVVCLLFVYALMKPRDDERVSFSKIVGILLTFVSILGLFELYEDSAGGFVGQISFIPLHYLFGSAVSSIILGAFVLTGIFLIFNTSFIHLFSRKISEEDHEDENDAKIAAVVELSQKTDATEEVGDETNDENANEGAKTKKSIVERVKLGKIGKADFTVTSFVGPYDPPPLSLLNRDKGRPDSGDVKTNMMTIRRTLKKFHIEVEIDSVTPGPTFTRYAIKPAEGVKLERITNLQANLELALASSPIRIEAPIPGKSLVGIEVPNKERQTIGIASLFNHPQYTDSPKPLLTALGKDTAGDPEFADVARMPHGLIAGTTGSGKSVVIHNIIISLLFRNSPEQLRFIMVDPKMVELTLYNGIPHLLTPVITDAKKVLVALRWATKEMDRRYEVLQGHRVQNIVSYHEKVYQPSKRAYDDSELPLSEREAPLEALPYIVIIIDELADLMSTYPKELEASIVRLAQKSRAVGIHLILATQRPEVKVITGLIKANLPTRIALNVKSLIDSRTILDQSGAEKLLGKGDMLFLSQESPKPRRLQSAFVTEDEVKKVVSYLKSQDTMTLDSINLEAENGNKIDIMDSLGDDDIDTDDDLYEDAKQAVLEAGKASTSYLQRKLRIGYSRAARLMDILEQQGVIGAQDGSKAREVLNGQGENTDSQE